MANVSGMIGNAMELRTVLMGAMKLQNYAGPFVKRWWGDGPAQMANASGNGSNVTDTRTVVMGVMRMPHFVAMSDQYRRQNDKCCEF